MIEFFMARVTVVVSAALIIGLVFAPVTDTLMDETDDMASDNCKAIGEAVDRFFSSEANEAILDIRTYIPNDDYMLSFKGRLLTLSDSDTLHCYDMRTFVSSDYEFYGTTDVIILTKENGRVHASVAVPA